MAARAKRDCPFGYGDDSDENTRAAARARKVAAGKAVVANMAEDHRHGLNNAMLSANMGEHLRPDEIVMLGTRFALIHAAMLGINEYDAVRRSAFFDWRKIKAIADARGIEIPDCQ